MLGHLLKKGYIMENHNKELQKDHDYVVKAVREMLLDFEAKDVRTDLAIHTSLCVILDTAIDSSPDRRELFGLISSAMSAAYEVNSAHHEECTALTNKDDLVH